MSTTIKNFPAIHAFEKQGAQMTQKMIALVLLVSGASYLIKVLLEGAGTAAPSPTYWAVLIMGAVLIPLRLWVFSLAERHARRTGKLARNG